MSGQTDSTFFQCEDCPKSFPMRMDYNRHRKVVHNKSFLCLLCGKKYGLKTDLQRHHTTHELDSEKIKFKCPFSQCKFKGSIRRTHLREHLKKKHHSVDIDKALAESTKQLPLARLNSRHLRFCEAVCQGLEEEVEAFISEGIDISGINPQGLTAGHFAIRRGHTNILKTLLQQGLPTTNGYDYPSSPLLKEALKSGCIDMVKIILDYGAEINCWSSHIIKEGHVSVEIVRMLMSYPLAADRFYLEETLLHLVAPNYPELIEELLERGLDVNAKTMWNETPLSLTLRRNFNDKSARLLLDAGATISSRDWDRMPIDLRTEYAHLRVE